MYAAHVSKDERVHSLLCHAQETARLAGGFAGAFGAKEWGYPIGYYHDLGKSSPEFKRRLFEGGPKVDHSTAGAVHALSSLGLIGAYCIMGHHGGLPEGGTQTDVEGTSTVHGRPQKKLPKYDPNALPPPPFAAPKSPPFPLKDGFACSFFIRMLFSCLVDADYLSTEAFMENRPSAWGGYSDMETLKRRLDAHLAQFENPKELIRKKRNEILKDCRTAALGPRGLYTLTVPTGGGKTISSLAFAIDHALKHGFDRVIYVIPYTSIIEQNAGVFREIVGSENVVEHHASFTFDDEDPVSVRQRLATENWDAPLIVTTNVQFFESLFASATGRCRKLHSIARSVVIFDEAQMLPLDYVKPCTRAISELVQNYGVTAVLMSATQPALASFFPKDMPSFEMMKDPHELHEFFRRTTLCTLPPHSEEQLLEKLVGHEQVLCILNTRKRAQALYGRLPRDGGSFHLSTLMTPGHRSRKID